jgi:hypothetical protein
MSFHGLLLFCTAHLHASLVPSLVEAYSQVEGGQNGPRHVHAAAPAWVCMRVWMVLMDGWWIVKARKGSHSMEESQLIEGFQLIEGSHRAVT